MALTKVSGSILKDPLNLGEVSIGGTLTYQDVTNVDSVGVITARTGIDIVAGDLVIPDSIIHRSDANTKIRFPADDTFTVETAGGERLRITADGKVGIGSAIPEKQLTVRKGSGDDGGILVLPNVSYANNQNRAYLTVGTGNWTGATTNWNTYGLQHRFKTNASGVSRVTIDGATGEFFCVENGGNIGIGTNDPAQELSIWNSAPGIRLVDTDPYEEGAYGQISQSGSVLQIIADSGNTSGHGSVFFYAFNDNDTLNTYRISDNLHQWYISGTEEMRLDANGRLGIGTVTSSAKLEVRDSASTGIIVRTDSTQTTDTNKALRVRNNSDTNTLSVSYKGLLEISRGELGTYLKVGGDDASNGRALTFTSSNTSSNGALHTLNATSGNGAIALATAGTERFRVDSDGNVTKPNNPMFRATMTASRTISSSDWHKIQFDTDTASECFDVGSNFDTSTHRFTAPVTGYYQFGLNQRIDGGNNQYYRVAFYKNGSPGGNYSNGMAIYRDTDGFNYYTFSITSLIQLNASQYVEAYAYSYNDTSWTTQRESIFYGYLVG